MKELEKEVIAKPEIDHNVQITSIVQKTVKKIEVKEYYWFN